MDLTPFERNLLAREAALGITPEAAATVRRNADKDRRRRERAKAKRLKAEAQADSRAVKQLARRSSAQFKQGFLSVSAGYYA